MKLKYFVLKPRGHDEYARASRQAMMRYAQIIQDVDPTFANEIVEWAQQEQAALLDSPKDDAPTLRPPIGELSSVGDLLPEGTIPKG